MPSDLEEILARVYEHIKMSDELSVLNKYKGTRNGFEGWFKVEVDKALEHTSYFVKQWRNGTSDLLLANGVEIELKAGCNFDLGWIKKEGLKYNVPCLFMCDGNDEGKVESLEADDNVETIGLKVISYNKEKWIIGMIRPRQQ